MDYKAFISWNESAVLLLENSFIFEIQLGDAVISCARSVSQDCYCGYTV